MANQATDGWGRPIGRLIIWADSWHFNIGVGQCLHPKGWWKQKNKEIGHISACVFKICVPSRTQNTTILCTAAFYLFEIIRVEENRDNALYFLNVQMLFCLYIYLMSIAISFTFVVCQSYFCCLSHAKTWINKIKQLEHDKHVWPPKSRLVWALCAVLKLGTLSWLQHSWKRCTLARQTCTNTNTVTQCGHDL